MNYQFLLKNKMSELIEFNSIIQYIGEMDGFLNIPCYDQLNPKLNDQFKKTGGIPELRKLLMKMDIDEIQYCHDKFKKKTRNSSQSDIIKPIMALFGEFGAKN